MLFSYRFSQPMNEPVLAVIDFMEFRSVLMNVVMGTVNFQQVSSFQHLYKTSFID